jgi:thymidylate synthase ThyX
MKLRTLVNVNGQGLYNEIGIGVMNAIAPIADGSLEYSGVYTKEDGTIVKTIESKFTAEQVQTLYDEIKDQLTPNLNGVLSIWEQVYLAFRIEMASAFGINTNQIEIC